MLFLFSNFLYLSSIIISAITEPWRKPLYTNVPFVVTFLIVTAYSVFIVVLPPVRVTFFEISYMDDTNVNLFVLVVGLLFAMLCFLNKKILIDKCFPSDPVNN
jgi:magnesium-transporting ATPase (P-type)